MSGMMCQPGTDHVHSMECSPNTMFYFETWEMPCYHSVCTRCTENSLRQNGVTSFLNVCASPWSIWSSLSGLISRQKVVMWFHRMWLHSSLVCFLLVVPCWGSNKMYLIITLVNCLSDVQKRLHLCLSLRWFARLFFIYIRLIIH